MFGFTSKPVFGNIKCFSEQTKAARQGDRRFGGREEVCSEVLGTSSDVIEVLELSIDELCAFYSLFSELKTSKGRVNPECDYRNANRSSRVGVFSVITDLTEW